MKKNICFDFTPYVYGRAAGYNEYTMALLKGLSETEKNWCNVIIFIRADQEVHFSEFKSKLKFKKINLKSVTQRVLWQNFFLPFFCKIDFFVFTGNLAPILFFKPYALVTHDLNFLNYPLNFSYLGFLYRKLVIKRSIKNSRISISISHQVKKEISEKYAISSVVIYNAVKYPKLIEKQLENYVVCASSLAKHKNIINAYNACKQLVLKNQDVNCYFIGNWNAVDFPVNNVSPNIHLLGYVSDEEKNTLFSQAQCILCPSTYEGFGIPYIEAIFHKKILVCSDIPIAREIAVDYAVYISSPYGEKEILKSLLSIDFNSRPPISSNTDHIKKFDPAFIASQYLKTIYDYV